MLDLSFPFRWAVTLKSARCVHGPDEYRQMGEVKRLPHVRVFVMMRVSGTLGRHNEARMLLSSNAVLPKDYLG